MNPTFIKIPLYKLNYVSDIDEIKLNEEFLSQYRSEYDAEERKGIFEQLDWAVKNPNYDFNSLVASDEFSDEEIYGYIQKLHGFLSENQTF